MAGPGTTEPTQHRDIQNAPPWVVEGVSPGHHGRLFDLGSSADHSGAPEGGEGDAKSWWTSERGRLLGWLEENAPALAPFYRGALLLAMRDSFPGRVHFIAHAIREIRNRLPGALGTKVRRRDAGYERLTDKLRERWLEEGLPKDGGLPPPDQSAPSASGPSRRDVSCEFLASVGRLIEEHNEAQANRRAREEHAFDALSDLGPNPQYVAKNWHKPYGDAEKFAHAADKPRPAEADREWVAKFFQFERVLMTISKPSYENLDDLDRLLEQANRR